MRALFNSLVFCFIALFLTGCSAFNTPPPSSTAVAGQNTVTVHAGENLYDVAKRLNVSTRDLIDANHLQPPYTLKTGQVLSVAVPKTYTVIKGDSLYGIAHRFGVGQTDLAQLNHLASPYKIFVGQQLQLPGGHQAEPLIAATTTRPTPAAIVATPLPPQKSGTVNTSSLTALAPPQAQLQAQVIAPNPPVAATSEPVSGNTPNGFLWPVKGTIISSFGPKPGGLHNDGINIAAVEGTPVKSAAAGTIAYAGNELRGFGNLILIRHNDGWVTAYAHLANMAVKKGDTVKAGQIIGAVGQTGSVDTPQLHFELRRGKDAVDPSQYLGESKS